MAALAALPDEAVGQLDVGEMLVAGHGILEGVATRLGEPVNREYRLQTLSLD